MSNVLKIKSRQSGSAGAPASLARAELAYNEQDDTIYIGHGSGTDSSRTKKAIGGVGAFVDKASSQVLTNKDLTATSNSFTVASATQSGVVELATNTEANAGSDAFRAVTPANLGAFTGNTNITTVGTISTGVWSGTKLVAGKVPNIEDLTVGGDLAMGGNKITGLADPTAANGAATKSYVDAVKTGLDVKDSVRVATTAGISGFPSPGSQVTVDGVSLANNDRVLVKNESTTSNNGIWFYNSSNHSFTRATDADGNDEVTAGMFTFVTEGTANADTGWVLTTNDTIAVGTTGLAFSQFSGAGSFVDGNGLVKTGNTLAVDLKTNGGIVFDSGELKIDLGASGIDSEGDLPASKVSGLGSLATLSAVGAAQITDNTVGAAELNVSGNGTNGQYLITDGDGSFSWQTLPVTGGTGINVDSNYVLSIDSTVATLTGTQTLTNKTIDCGTF